MRVSVCITHSVAALQSRPCMSPCGSPPQHNMPAGVRIGKTSDVAQLSDELSVGYVAAWERNKLCHLAVLPHKCSDSTERVRAVADYLAAIVNSHRLATYIARQ